MRPRKDEKDKKKKRTPRKGNTRERERETEMSHLPQVPRDSIHPSIHPPVRPLMIMKKTWILPWMGNEWGEREVEGREGRKTTGRLGT